MPLFLYFLSAECPCAKTKTCMHVYRCITRQCLYSCIFLSTECPFANDGTQLVACPTPNRYTGEFECIDEYALCDNTMDCDNGEDEDGTVCMFHKVVSTATKSQRNCNVHDEVIKWKHFPRYWPFVRGIHRWPVNSPHKGQWRGALMFSLICWPRLTAMFSFECNYSLMPIFNGWLTKPIWS